MAKTASLIYLEPVQKKKLNERSKKHGTSMAEEVRRAVNYYLQGEITEGQLGMMEIASKRAEESIERMTAMLRKLNRRAERLFMERRQ